MSGQPPAPRAAVAKLPAYKPGRSAAEVAALYGLTDAIKLASNELPYGPLPSVLEAMQEALTNCERYPDMGAAPIRNALCEDLGIAGERLTVGCGSSGLLQGVAAAFCGDGDEILYPWRSFEAYPIMSIQTGATPVTVPLRRQAIDLATVAAAVTPRTRLVFLANPNNPTGPAFSQAEFDTFLAGLPDGILVVLDEAYTEFATRTDLPDGLAYADRHPNVVVSRTFSKAYGLAGLRLGYAVGDPTVIEALDKVRIPFSINAVAQAAGVASVQAGEELAERVDAVVAERTRVEAALRDMGLGLPDPQGNFVWLAAAGATERLAEGLESRGIGGRAFPGEGVRVTVASPADNDRFLAAVEAVVGPDGQDVAADWQLPTGETARRAGAWLGRLDAVVDRLAGLAGDRRAGSVPDPSGGSEGWTEAQVWDHLAATSSHRHQDLRRLVDGTSDAPAAPSAAAGTPGVTEPGTARPIEASLAELLTFYGQHRHLLAGLSDDDWARPGSPDTGGLGVEDMVDQQLIGYLEETASRLEALPPVED